LRPLATSIHEGIKRLAGIAIGHPA
jgi:hypothetical protein